MFMSGFYVAKKELFLDDVPKLCISLTFVTVLLK